jgi:hypothetical protein
MQDINNLNRVRQKCLEMIFALSQIDANCEKILTGFSEETLRDIEKGINSFNSSSELMQSSLMLFLKDISQIDEDDEILGAETEEGYRL